MGPWAPCNHRAEKEEHCDGKEHRILGNTAHFSESESDVFCVFEFLHVKQMEPRFIYRGKKIKKKKPYCFCLRSEVLVV